MSAVRAKMGRVLWIVLVTSLAAACGRGVGENRVQFGVQGDVETLRPLLTLTATAGDWTLVVNGDEIGTPEDENPTRMCFGCMGYKAFAIPEGLTGAQQDSLFMVWGGNSISNPVVY